MAGEIQLNSTTMATESSGSITAQLDTIRPNTTNGSLTLQGDSSDAGVTGLTIDSSGVVNTTTAKVTNIQATSGQSLTIKDEDGNAAITIGTDNTAASYLSLNFGSYHGDSGGAGSGTLSANTLDDYETGTFTPEVYDATTGGNQLSGAHAGSYTKIGDLVTIHFYFYNINTTGATSGNSLHFRNLPFTTESLVNQGATMGSVRCHGIVTGGGFLTAHSAESTNFVRVFVMGNNTADYALRVQDIGTSGTSDIEFSLTYRAV